jgi:hypothetical protein
VAMQLHVSRAPGSPQSSPHDLCSNQRLRPPSAP